MDSIAALRRGSLAGSSIVRETEKNFGGLMASVAIGGLHVLDGLFLLRVHRINEG